MRAGAVGQVLAATFMVAAPSSAQPEGRWTIHLGGAYASPRESHPGDVHRTTFGLGVLFGDGWGVGIDVERRLTSIVAVGAGVGLQRLPFRPENRLGFRTRGGSERVFAEGGAAATSLIVWTRIRPPLGWAVRPYVFAGAGGAFTRFDAEALRTDTSTGRTRRYSGVEVRDVAPAGMGGLGLEATIAPRWRTWGEWQYQHVFMDRQPIAFMQFIGSARYSSFRAGVSFQPGGGND